METIEEIYAGMLEEHELVLAARRQERIKAANPYGCNQYGHRKGHGSSSGARQSESAKKSKKEEEKPLNYQDIKSKMASAVFDIIRKAKYTNNPDSLYFNGKTFSTSDMGENGPWVEIVSSEDFSDFLTDMDMSGIENENDITNYFMETLSEIFFEEHYDKWKK